MEEFDKFGSDTPEFWYIAVLRQKRGRNLVSSKMR